MTQIITPEYLATALVMVLAPGTGMVYTLGVGIAQGRRASIAAAFGSTLSILPHLVAATLGLAALLHTSALAFQFVKYAGVAFLLYLAYQALRENGPLSFKDTDTPRNSQLGKIIARGVMASALNPKLSIFFLAFLPQFLSGQPATATREMVILGAIFMAMTFGVFVIYGLFASAARDKVLRSPKVMTWLRRAFAASFAGLGLKLAFEKS